MGKSSGFQPTATVFVPSPANSCCFNVCALLCAFGVRTQAGAGAVSGAAGAGTIVEEEEEEACERRKVMPSLSKWQMSASCVCVLVCVSLCSRRPPDDRRRRRFGGRFVARTHTHTDFRVDFVQCALNSQLLHHRLLSHPLAISNRWPLVRSRIRQSLTDEFTCTHTPHTNTIRAREQQQ